jgi:hypothetical protein
MTNLDRYRNDRTEPLLADIFIDPADAPKEIGELCTFAAVRE